jgi:Uma2 family endonuclease
MAVEYRRWKITVDTFNRMIDDGYFGPEDRVELIRGELVNMAPIGHEHAGHVKQLNRMLTLSIGDRGILGVQDPLILEDLSQPQPDIAILRSRIDFYARSNPTAQDVLLIIEVSDSTLAYDRQVKGPLYAEAGIADYWIVNLPGEQIIVHRDPTPTGYRSVQVLRRGEMVSPLAFPDLQIAVSDVLI